MDFETARRTMVDSQVRPNDVTDIRIQDAMATTPREAFLPAGLREQAYVELELAYADDRTLITPRDFAKLIALAAPRAGDIVLDVGCGTGYSTAVLAKLCEMVVAVESDEALAASAQQNWSDQGIDNAAAVVGPLADGAQSQAPFDRIVVAAAVEETPTALLQQLRDGGRLVAIVRAEGVSRGVVYSRSGEAFSSATRFDATARHVPQGFEKPKAFVF